MARGIHRKATYEDRYYRRNTCGKINHPQGWHKDKIICRKGLRRFLKAELEERIEEEYDELD
jgi:hypothetical protein